MKVTLEEKYNHCLALNIELEEIVEMQNRELMLKDREINYLKEVIDLASIGLEKRDEEVKELEKYKKWYLQEVKSVVGIL